MGIRMNKKVTTVVSLILMICMFIPIMAMPASASEVQNEVTPRRYIIEEVPWYYDRVEYYDGSSYTSPTVYKELRLKSASSSYSSTCGIKFIYHDTYYNNVKVKTWTRWEYTYTIYN